MARRFAPASVAAALALALALAGCRSAPVAPLRVGISAEPGYEFAYLAEARGFFASQGVNVRLVQFESMSDSRRAFERGQLDGFFGTPFEVLQASANTVRRPVMVRVLDRSRGFDVVLGGPRVPDARALVGKRVAVEPGSLSLYLLSRALERGGHSLAAVRLVDVAPAEMPAALAHGEVDAAVCYPPVSLAIVRAGAARPVFTSAQVPGEIVDVLAFDAAVLASRRDDVSGFLAAYDRAVAWTSGNEEAAVAIMAGREGLTPREFRASLEQGLELVSATRQAEYFGRDGLLPRIVAATAAVLRQTGQSPAPVPPGLVPAAEDLP